MSDYIKKYMLKRYWKRRNETLEKLGGCCRICKTKEKLELDHIDPNSKSFEISQIWNYRKEVFNKEIEKCQILCKKCHIEKTLIDNNKISAKNTHGTLSSLRYCKCGLCKKAKSEYMKVWKLKKKMRSKLI
jgi:hypothetical protein